MSEFNPKSARAKRPCPLWVDAFQRDTQHLEADEVGAYFLILMAMWTRETCDFPDDNQRLARVSRVSKRLWNSRIGPVILQFFEAKDGVVISKRLRKEATYVERQVKQQSDRKRGQNSDNLLKTNDPTPTADDTTDEPRHYPSQQPNNPIVSGGEIDKSIPPPPTGGGGFSDQDWSGIVAAVGYDPDGPMPEAWRQPNGVAQAWLDLGLTPERIASAAKASRSYHKDPPATPQALDGTMASEAARPAKAPIASQQEQMQFWAKAINGDGYVAPSSVTPNLARALVGSGMVTAEKLKERGIAQ